MKQTDSRIQGRRSRRGGAVLLLATAALTLTLAGSLVAIALASSSLTVVSSSNSKLGKIVVDTKGRSLYALSPETTRHLLCKTSECFKFWPPLTVSSSKTKLAARGGVQGSLGLLNRGKGVVQVTLNGEPLYYYSGDHGKAGTVNGQHIHSFGGVWHVISASGGKKSNASSPGAPAASSKGESSGGGW